ncbi:TRM11 family SAM-dependent methyltransferase [Ureibacillus sp. MALMAid1270]|uniref:TRM11 family SAM-dependent methyltransferase n=1 Tax=Ureibacillus sp. MALMAid1270 TaxID=3411629 RepID=UPI003BA49E93
MYNLEKKSTYIYTYVHQVEEFDLCRMEMRALFGFDTELNYLWSDTDVNPDRSPFIQDRIEILFEGDTVADIKEAVKVLNLEQSTYKVICLNKMGLGETKKIPHPERRSIEREIGLCIEGEPELDHPDVVFGLISLENRWYFGHYVRSESIWRKHVHKPKSYSTALNTRLARAISNIAIPKIENVRAIDPCCGIGTVLIEALSMGINIVGRDISPFVCIGARENIAYFELDGVVTKGPISEVQEHYDVAIIDLPYNIYSHISKEQEYEIIYHARRIADRVLFVSIDPIEHFLEKVGFTIIDRCEAKKQQFVRHILLCE